jgi:hypothetical protein
LEIFGGLELLETDRDQCQLLADVVVQFSCDALTLLLLSRRTKILISLVDGSSGFLCTVFTKQFGTEFPQTISSLMFK